MDSKDWGDFADIEHFESKFNQNWLCWALIFTKRGLDFNRNFCIVVQEIKIEEIAQPHNQ
jgi:hypothetical protein